MSIAHIKDHLVAQAVNRLRQIAIDFRDSQQLRDRIARIVTPLAKGDAEDLKRELNAYYGPLNEAQQIIADGFANVMKDISGKPALSARLPELHAFITPDLNKPEDPFNTLMLALIGALYLHDEETARELARKHVELKRQRPPVWITAPIDMLLYCPKCGEQHIDEPEAEDDDYHATVLSGRKSPRWTNPPHRSHLCHHCDHIWRPADVPTNGVKAIKTKGQHDSPESEREE